MNNFDPETLKIPAYLRKNAIVSQSKQRLILTALDRKEAGLNPHSKKAVAPIKKLTRGHILSKTPRFHKSPFLQDDPVAETVEPAQKAAKRQMPQIGVVTHYLDKINVAIIKLSATLKNNDLILIEGQECIFYQPVEEMQIDRNPVTKAAAGSHIGLKVSFPVTVEGKVYKLY